MHRVLKKDQILTIPNLLSIVRLLLIPVILFPGMPEVLANTWILLCIAMLVFSFVRYARFYKKLFADKKE